MLPIKHIVAVVAEADFGLVGNALIKFPWEDRIYIAILAYEARCCGYR